MCVLTGIVVCVCSNGDPEVCSSMGIGMCPSTDSGGCVCVVTGIVGWVCVLTGIPRCVLAQIVVCVCVF